MGVTAGVSLLKGAHHISGLQRTRSRSVIDAGSLTSKK